jgi:outer membrane protein assembly factor BamD (BamD/ComL family)
MRRATIYLFTALFACNAYGATLNDAQKDYLNGDYEEALIKAKKLAENDEVLYFLGLTYIKIGNYPQAREYLGKLTKSYSRSKFYEQGLVKFADTYFLEGDFERSRALYEEMEKKYPSSDYLPLIYFRLAQIAAKEGKWADSEKYTAFLKDNYPNSPEMSLVATLEEAGDFFTIQVGAFAEKKNALELQEELKKNYSVYIIEEKNGGYTLYKVRVGKFKDRQEAEEIRYRLARQGYPARIYP